MKLVKMGIVNAFLLISCIADNKPPVIFEVSTLITQDTDARKKTLIKQLQEKYHRKNYGTLALWHTIRDVFDVPFFCNEREVRLEFYKFLEKIQLSKQYPTITFEGDSLPPIMAAWNLGQLSAQEAMRIANEYLDKQDYPENTKKFYQALLFVTFDPTVTKSTKSINNKTQKLIDNCCSYGYPVYLVGHCDLVSCAWLKENNTDLLSKFSKIFFSNQVKTLPQTGFDDNWWLSQLGLTSKTDINTDYIYVCDWLEDGTKGDAPPHYACSSKKLRKILAQTEL